MGAQWDERCKALFEVFAENGPDTFGWCILSIALLAYDGPYRTGAWADSIS